MKQTSTGHRSDNPVVCAAESAGSSMKQKTTIFISQKSILGASHSLQCGNIYNQM